MPAYLISEVEVHNPQAYEEYRKLVGATLQTYGGKFLARGGKIDVLEGRWNPKRIVICVFDSVAAARKWYDSEEYKKPKAIRQKNSTANIVLVEGV